MPHSTVTALALTGAEHYYGKAGIDVIETGRQLDIEESLWDDLDRDIPLRQFVSLLESLGDQSNDPASLWQSGLDFDFRLLGDVGKVLGKTRTLGDALTKFRDFFYLVQTDAHLDLRINEQETRIQYKILDTNIWPRRKDAEFTLGVFHGLISHYTGKQSAPFSFKLEDYSGTGVALERQVQRPFAGSGDFNELLFPTSLLYCERSESPCQPEVQLQPLVRELEEKNNLKKRNTPLAYRVQCCIYSMIGRSPVDQTRVAEYLGMSRRTLRRKLSDENYSFQQLLDRCRMQMIAMELIRGDLSFTEIALKTGYSEQSAMTRAFSKWSGKTPAQFRRENKPGSNQLIPRPH